MPQSSVTVNIQEINNPNSINTPSVQNNPPADQPISTAVNTLQNQPNSHQLSQTITALDLATPSNINGTTKAKTQKASQAAKITPTPNSSATLSGTMAPQTTVVATETVTFKGQPYTWTFQCNGTAPQKQRHRDLFLKALEARPNIEAGDKIDFEFVDNGYNLTVTKKSGGTPTATPIRDSVSKALAEATQIMNEYNPSHPFEESSLNELFSQTETLLKQAELAQNSPPATTPPQTFEVTPQAETNSQYTQLDENNGTQQTTEANPLSSIPHLLSSHQVSQASTHAPILKVMKIIRESEEGEGIGLELGYDGTYSIDPKYRFACSLKDRNKPEHQIGNSHVLDDLNILLHKQKNPRGKGIVDLEDGTIKIGQNGTIFFKKTPKNLNEVKELVTQILEKAENEENINYIELPLLNIEGQSKTSIYNSMKQAIIEYNHKIATPTSQGFLPSTKVYRTTSIKAVKISVSEEDVLQICEGTTTPPETTHHSTPARTISPEENLGKRLREQKIKEKITVIAENATEQTVPISDLQELLNKANRTNSIPSHIEFSYSNNSEIEEAIKILEGSKIKTTNLPKITLKKRTVD